MYRTRLQEKLDEALSAILPVIAIVLVLALTIAPVESGVLLSFLFGGVLLVLGNMFFTLGAELAMEPIGQHMGTAVTKSRSLRLLLAVGFSLGVLITVSEPDLQVLAGQVQSISNSVLIFSVAGGVGFFLALALLRILLGIRLRTILWVCYGLVFLMACFAPRDFLAVAFDAGGVTTGPMTVPFIMAFGIGVSSIRSDRRASDDSFGLISLCSVGPILAVLALSLIYKLDSAAYTETVSADVADSVALGAMFASSFPTYIGEILRALLPIGVFFGVFQVIKIRLGSTTLIRIGVGLLYTYIGLVVFLTGVNVGFMPAGTYLGRTLASLPYRWIIVPLGMLIGYYIVKAEPAVYVLMRQVEELTSGAVSGIVLQRSLSIGVSVSVGLAMVRVLTGVSVLYLVVPGYALALGLSFVVPDVFTAIAFDSGGVASGPMTATFLLPFATGACLEVGGNVVTDAFGVVAMVSMTPLITIQILGFITRIHLPGKAVLAEKSYTIDIPDNYAIIEL